MLYAYYGWTLRIVRRCRMTSLRDTARCVADDPRPCRISLTDATPGDELILVNYEHHAVASPYRMRFAIYVRQGERTFDAID